jgi:spermidine/putrescine transport system substrate-binding protein
MARKSASTIRYPTPNAAALALMPPDYRDNPAIFPPAAALAHCEYSRFTPLLASGVYERAMTQLRAS